MPSLRRNAHTTADRGAAATARRSRTAARPAPHS